MTTKTFGYYWTPAPSVIDQQLAVLEETGANAVYVPHGVLDLISLEDLHRRNIRLFVDWGMFVGEELRRLYPDSVPIDDTGTPFDREEWYIPVCPNHPQVRAHHLQAIGNLLDRHGHALVALWLDFIRYPVRWEGRQPRLRSLCFCRYCLNLFLQIERTHYSVDETRVLARNILQERQVEWVDWKCTRVAGFVQDIRVEIVKRNLPTQLGMFSLPWRRTDFDGALRSVAGQDLGLLSQYVDVISPMVYHKLCHQPASWIENVTLDALAWTGRPVLPIIQSLDQPDVMSLAELDAALAHALKTPAEGVMLFTLDPLLKSVEKRAVVRRHFSS
jgi:hypothetical protein